MVGADCRRGVGVASGWSWRGGLVLRTVGVGACSCGATWFCGAVSFTGEGAFCSYGLGEWARRIQPPTNAATLPPVMMTRKVLFSGRAVFIRSVFVGTIHELSLLIVGADANLSVGENLEDAALLQDLKQIAILSELLVRRIELIVQVVDL